MVLLDRVISLDPGIAIVAEKTITPSEPCYASLPQGLSHARYAYPVSLIVESFGQAAALLWLNSRREVRVNGERALVFAGLRNLYLSGSAFPGEVLQHRVHLESAASDAIFAGGEIWIGPRRLGSVGSIIAVSRTMEQLGSSGLVPVLTQSHEGEGSSIHLGHGQK